MKVHLSTSMYSFNLDWTTLPLLDRTCLPAYNKINFFATRHSKRMVVIFGQCISVTRLGVFESTWWQIFLQKCPKYLGYLEKLLWLCLSNFWKKLGYFINKQLVTLYISKWMIHLFLENSPARIFIITVSQQKNGLGQTFFDINIYWGLAHWRIGTNAINPISP